MHEGKLNILYLSSWYPSRVHSTLGNFVQRHAECIASKHNVTVLYTAFEQGEVNYPQIEDNKKGQLRTIVVYGKKGFPEILNKWLTFRKAIDYLEKNNDQKFDLIHHNVIWNDAWQAVFLSHQYKIPLVVTEHWTGYDTINRADQPRLLKFFSKWVAKNTTVFCPVSDDLGKKMKNFGLEGNYVVVPNVVDTGLFRVTQKPSEYIQFLHVSSLDDRQKNIRGILRVWKKITLQTDRIKLLIGGDGPYNTYKSEAKKLSIAENTIEFFGEKSPQEIAGLMEQSHCLILFSNYENLPVVIIEALASGMFVVSTDVGGISEHIDDTRGILCKAGDEDDLEKSMFRAIQQIKNFDGEQSRNYAIKHFSRESISQHFDDVYRMAIEEYRKND